MARAIALALTMTVGAGLGRATCAPEVRVGVTEVEHYRVPPAYTYAGASAGRPLP